NHQKPSTSICKNIYNKISPDCFSWVFFINTPTLFPASHNNAENNIALRPSEKGFQTAFAIISICHAIPGKNTQNSLCLSAYYGQFKRTLRFNFTIRLFCVISHFCSRNFIKPLALLLQIHYISLHKEQTLGKAKYAKA
ncbi:hypothetical protein, partial [Uruburuella suis]|uniref:hypothetical protein n=1 Tax=Uruburuella suis TaxID=252130 RepID=UPI003F4A9E94